ncbi:alpha/beta fold hydrolase BchO [Pseudogemmobacter blasticus]|uniref:Magnesium chelatase n=1 Tax=Fuscovulum blasticum DSM 2131 TaxID=1188250 RepID=A0A2T4J4Z2_FUSBL|nr:alpha/beta fold hydrolase BchO [Fuscovulum blasticum]PTE12961.1 magnesium chelatase [Fuscovulum blasticum DSM 2131]
MEPARLPRDWPYRDRISRIACAPNDWAVLDIGTGPDVLLLHGAGGSAHSFRNLIPHLSGYRVLAIDHPGQGCTRAGNRARLGIDAVAEDLARLIAQQGWQPQAVIGHSAGAALALRLAESVPLRAVVGINAALGTFEGAAGVLFPLFARVLAATPFVPDLFSRVWGNAAAVNRLIGSTGSHLDAAGLAQYLWLVQNRGHVDGTLAMMAAWRLEPLLARLPRIVTPVQLIASSGDRTVPARISRAAAGRMTTASYQELPRLGHLVHEEAADKVAALLLPWLQARLNDAAEPGRT